MKNSIDKKEWVIHFSGDDYWHSNPHSRYHLTKSLQKKYNILWINPIGSRFPPFKKKGFALKIFRKLKSIFMIIRKSKDDFWIVTLIIIPIFKQSKLQKINKLLYTTQLSLLFYFLKIRKPILFYTSPIFADTLELINKQFSIYYYSDQYNLYREFSLETRKYITELDDKLYRNCDLILCASKKIYNNVRIKTYTKVIYFPHQVDFQLFSKNRNNEKPNDIKNIPHPIIGYYGTLTDSNDWDIIKYCAEKRPNYNFVFIGRKDFSLKEIEKLKNVYFLGKKLYEEIPVYGDCFDVGIMFWIRREWIKSCSPLKLKEYLALQLPVVSTKIEEVANVYTDIVYSAESKEDFLKYLDEAVNSDNTKRIKKGVEMISKDNWDKIIEILNEELRHVENCI